jgi:ribose-phosphate pyrophosphokinase
METIYFAMPGNEALAVRLTKKARATLGNAECHKFPDGETLIRILSDLREKQVAVVCTLHQPDDKLLPLYFFCKTARSLGAAKIILIAPYLAYMRQDRVFKPGEGITSFYFASFISTFADELITIDPHLHRIKSPNEIYSIPVKVSHAAPRISSWITTYVDNPVIIGPDRESEQWVLEVAAKAGASSAILEKTRHGDLDVEILAPQMKKFRDHTPVLVDDIISSGKTMIETLRQLKTLGMKPAVCIGVHAVFAGNAHSDLVNAGALKVVTTNTIPHSSNGIDISDLLA